MPLSVVDIYRDILPKTNCGDCGSADLAMLIRPLPRVPIMLMFWDEDQEDGFEAQAKLLFDETVTEHLDIESIVFLSERLRQLLCGANPDRRP